MDCNISCWFSCSTELLCNSSLRARQIWKDGSRLRGTSDSPECYRRRWQDSSYRRRRECYQGWDWLAGRPDRIETKEQQSSLCLLRRHTPQREVDHDSSTLHRWVIFPNCKSLSVESKSLLPFKTDKLPRRFGSCLECGTRGRQIMRLQFKLLSKLIFSVGNNINS